MATKRTESLYSLFASLLEYPTSETLTHVQVCIGKLREVNLEAARSLERFHQVFEGQTLEQTQELYTYTFDLQPVCCLYIGYQLFGESYKRGLFMAKLNEAYHEEGFSGGKELPDHVSVVLRFLGRHSDNKSDLFSWVLLQEGLIPALEKMVNALQGYSGNPYADVLSALQLALANMPEMELSHV